MPDAILLEQNFETGATGTAIYAVSSTTIEPYYCRIDWRYEPTGTGSVDVVAGALLHCDAYPQFGDTLYFVSGDQLPELIIGGLVSPDPIILIDTNGQSYQVNITFDPSMRDFGSLYVEPWAIAPQPGIDYEGRFTYVGYA